MNESYMAMSNLYMLTSIHALIYNRIKNSIKKHLAQEISLATAFQVGLATQTILGYEEHIYDVLRENDYE